MVLVDIVNLDHSLRYALLLVKHWNSKTILDLGQFKLVQILLIADQKLALLVDNNLLSGKNLQ